MPLDEIVPGTGADRTATPILDVVAVHGLNPFNNADHAMRTWQKTDRDGNERLWLRDRLPAVQPRARIFIYSYDSKPTFGENRGRFLWQADALLADIESYRDECPDRPLILIGHSLGGILIKQALVNAHANPHYEYLLRATRALVFFGTPHRGPVNGSLVSFGKLCAKLVQHLPGNHPNDIMDALQDGSLFSDTLKEHFRHQLENYQIVSFWEGLGELVPRDSATLGLSGGRENIVELRAYHSDLCRFDPAVREDEHNYRLVQTNISRLCREAERNYSERDEERINSVLKSLEPYSANQRYGKIEKTHQDSFQWIWDSTINGGTGFAEWLATGNEIFWISGKPGSGKSTLMKYVYDHPRTMDLLRKPGQGKAVSAGFFFYDQGTSTEQSCEGLLHSILYQIILQMKGLALTILPIFEKIERTGEGNLKQSIWTKGELESAFHLIAHQAAVRGSICLFIDAIDESQEEYHRETVKYLVELAEPRNWRGLTMKLCVASRRLNTIELRLQGYPGFEIHERTADDISNYVRSNLEETILLLRRENLPIKTLQILLSNVVEKASGVFIWVKLVVSDLIRALEDGESDEQIRKRLDDLPDELEDLYKRILHKIPSDDLHESLNYFEILLQATPISLLEFAVAADCCRADYVPDNERWSQDEIGDRCFRMRRLLQARCRGFVQLTTKVDEGSQVERDSRVGIASMSIDFLHRTAKDYISDTQCRTALLERVKRKDLVCNIEVVLMACQLKMITCDHFDIEALSGEENSRFVSRIGRCLFFANRAEKSTGRAQSTLLKQLEQKCDEQSPEWKSMYVARFCYTSGYDYAMWDIKNRNGKVTPAYNEWNPSMLSLAVIENLGLYVKGQLGKKAHFQNAAPSWLRNVQRMTLNSEKRKERPLLQYAVEYAGGYNRKREMTPMAKILLDCGEPLKTVFHGRTAWQLALEQNVPRESAHDWAELLILFLDRGADPNQIVQRKLEYKMNGYDDLLLERPALSWFMARFQGPVSDTVAVVTKFIAVGANLHVLDSDSVSVYDRLSTQAAEIPELEPLLEKVMTERENLNTHTTANSRMTSALSEPRRVVVDLLRRARES